MTSGNKIPEYSEGVPQRKLKSTRLGNVKENNVF
jgi:hypothetical protein